MSNDNLKIVVGVTGASGAVYAQTLVQQLCESTQTAQIYVIFTTAAKQVWQHELKTPHNKLAETSPKIKILENDDFFTDIASGSNPADALVIIPCSMGTVGRIASGISTTLLERCADVQLKEELPIIIAPRECPLSLIHLQNLTKLKQAGATIMPTSPSFYAHPTTITELTKTVTDRILQKLKIKNAKIFRWKQN